MVRDKVAYPLIAEFGLQTNRHTNAVMQLLFTAFVIAAAIAVASVSVIGATFNFITAIALIIIIVAVAVAVVAFVLVVCCWCCCCGSATCKEQHVTNYCFVCRGPRWRVQPLSTASEISWKSPSPS